jgi:hypothetical protein
MRSISLEQLTPESRLQLLFLRILYASVPNHPTATPSKVEVFRVVLLREETIRPI